MPPTRAIALGRSAVVAALFALACAHGAHAGGPAPASADPDLDGAAAAMIDTGDAGTLAARVSARLGALRGARALMHEAAAEHVCSEKDCVGPLKKQRPPPGVPKMIKIIDHSLFPTLVPKSFSLTRCFSLHRRGWPATIGNAGANAREPRRHHGRRERCVCDQLRAVARDGIEPSGLGVPGRRKGRRRRDAVGGRGP